MPAWPTPMRRARRACRAPCFAAIAAPACRRSIPTSSRSPVRSPARCWPPCPSIRPDVTFIHAQKAEQKRQCAGRRHHRHPEGSGAGGQARVVTVEEVVDNFDDLHPNLTVLPRWTIAAIVRRAGRLASVLRARLLCARQCRLSRMGRDRRRPREIRRPGCRRMSSKRAPDDFAGRVEHLRKAA